MNTPQRHRATEIEESSDLTSQIIGAAIEVHRALEPGLLESIYEVFNSPLMKDGVVRRVL